jgi:hypothetical protein
MNVLQSIALVLLTANAIWFQVEVGVPGTPPDKEVIVGVKAPVKKGAKVNCTASGGTMQISSIKAQEGMLYVTFANGTLRQTTYQRIGLSCTYTE